MLVLIFSILFIGQETIYKTDNLVIFIQTLSLTLLSLNARFISPICYQFFAGFNYWLGIFLTKPYGDKLLNQLDGGDGYLEYPPTTLQALIMVDANIIRHFLVLIAILIVIAVFYCITLCCS